MKEDPKDLDNKDYQTKTLNNYIVYAKEVKDWELKQRTTNYEKNGYSRTTYWNNQNHYLSGWA